MVRPGPRLASRRGFTFVEAVLATVIGSVVVLLAFSVLSVQSRAFGHLEARSIVENALRSAGDFASAEIRPVAQGGVALARADSLVLRQPMVVGMVCANASSTSYGYLPLDGQSLDTLNVGGYAFRADDGTWSYTSGSWNSLDTSFSQTAAERCAQAGADTVGVSEEFIRIPEYYAEGTVGMLYRTVTLSFAPSSVSPGTHGLYFAYGGGSRIEVQPNLMTGVHFQYHRLDTDTYETSVSSTDLGMIDRVRVVLAAEAGDAAPRELNLTIPLANAES